jgi:hypothetical protein
MRPRFLSWMIDLTDKVTVSNIRITYYQDIVRILWILLTTLLAFICWQIAGLVTHSTVDFNTLIGVAGSIFSVVAFFISILLFVSAKRTEAYYQELHDLATRSKEADIVHFDDFSDFVSSHCKRFSPLEGEELKELNIFVSTPVFGIGGGVECAEKFVGLLEKWYEHLSRIRNPIERPRVVLGFWEAEQCKQLFGNSNTFPLNRLRGALLGFVALTDRNVIDLRIVATPRADARIIAVHSRQRSDAALAVFSPISQDTLPDRKEWTIVAFWLNGPSGFRRARDMSEMLVRDRAGSSSILENVRDFEKFCSTWGIAS